MKLNEALHDVVINTESSLKTSPSEGHIHMGMLIDFEKKDDERSSTVVSPKLTTTQDIMDLFNQPKPMKPSQRPKIDVYFGSSFVLVDIVTLCNEEKFMRLFNTSSAPIGGLTIGLSLSPQQIKQRETLTIPYTGEIPVMIEICYTHLNEKHKETLKLSL